MIWKKGGSFFVNFCSATMEIHTFKNTCWIHIINSKTKTRTWNHTTGYSVCDTTTITEIVALITKCDTPKMYPRTSPSVVSQEYKKVTSSRTYLSAFSTVSIMFT